MEILLVVLVVVAVLVVFGVLLYNRLVRLRNANTNAFAQIDVQLKRRHDLIPNLVEAVKGYMGHERQTLEAVVKARDSAESLRQSLASAGGGGLDPARLAQLGQAEGALAGSLSRLFAVAEAYPDLKADRNVMQLQEELVSTENRVAYARQAFNDSALTYNNAAQTVPTNIVAGLFGFREAPMLAFEDREEIQRAPTVSFG